MGYSEPNDVRNLLAPGDWGGENPPTNTHTAADLDDTQLNESIDDADQLINSYLRRLYQVPIEPDSPSLDQVKTLSRNIAAYNATLTYRKGRDLTATDPVALRYQQAMSLLTAIRDDKSVLDLPGNSVAGSAAASSPINPYTGDLFGMDDFDLSYPGAYPPYRAW